ncbi:6-phosphofructokinase [Syntrophothermus lipocalidus]|uniref:ATP-dependent 6-phosphofructokinase n=1 Tax=Syntrophothermus lipocalidus (strain DSM 12680 / TGB-C1) TaxID=643648 RepID=D7CP25_SYNLT|nr:6-phosphofructokinase [Syntrophothermus lipocalidus]ADI02460.1 6-phosphofructokinase [Syntrophothermus lipocalidus DSM 12680]
MKKIAILTSGGDAPGMNAAVRAVVRAGIYAGYQVFGVTRGFQGLINGDFVEMTLGSVADIIHRGGTILRTSRCEEFMEEKGRLRGLEALRDAGIQDVIGIGGNGTIRGLYEFSKLGVNTVAIPGSIDNDIPYCDMSIGFDTAVNTVVSAINRIRDTATAHERIFIVEVMGRESGHIALTAGLAGGAESILIPEVPFDLDQVVERLKQGMKRGKLHSIIVVAEGCCGAYPLAREIQAKTGMDTKVTVLGHTQRGGMPSAMDRNLASRMGKRAVDLIVEGKGNMMTGYQGMKIVDVPLAQVIEGKKDIDLDICEIARILSI